MRWCRLHLRENKLPKVTQGKQRLLKRREEKKRRREAGWMPLASQAA
jgi:hypothetical protein